MTRFFNLFTQNSRRAEAWKDPAWADREFPAVVARSPLQLWAPGDPIPERGVRWLVGVATWCGFDMRLLDVIGQALEAGVPEATVVQVFNAAECRTDGDFRKYVSGLRGVYQTPIVGVWRDGRLQQAVQGVAARDLAAKHFGSSSPEIVQYVRQWIEAQSLAPGP